MTKNPRFSKMICEESTASRLIEEQEKRMPLILSIDATIHLLTEYHCSAEPIIRIFRMSLNRLLVPEKLLSSFDEKDSRRYSISEYWIISNRIGLLTWYKEWYVSRIISSAPTEIFSVWMCSIISKSFNWIQKLLKLIQFWSLIITKLENLS